ncbi:MAG TPA: hypothetical protein VK395_34330 [Gemmataceae bacterium]|nr:hypothetical protein [Gemmataceae bacterium]
MGGHTEPPQPNADAEVLAAQNLRAALAYLFDSHRYAQDLGRPAWDFAVEIHTLQSLGLTTGDLRWLTCKGYIEHADEVRRPGKVCRTFQSYGELSFSKRTCFIPGRTHQTPPQLLRGP